MSKSIKAISCDQNGKQFYVSKLDSQTLKKTCFISRTEDDPIEGYQRHLNPTRAKDIANYLDEKKGTIPSPIILSAQPVSQLFFDKGVLTFTIHKKSFLVIDGQHRIFGLYESKKNYEIPVVIFEGLDLANEAMLFIDINTTQKSVPASLLLAIKKLTGQEDSIDEKQRKLFDFLNTNSPLSGLLSSTKSVAGRISRAALVEATSSILKYGPIADLEFDIICQVVKNYLEAFERIFALSKSANAKLSKTLYFKSIFEIFNESITKCLAMKNNLKVDSIYQTLEPLSTIEFDNYSGTSYKTQSELVQSMRSELNKFEMISHNIL